MRYTIKVENEYFSNIVPNEHHNAIKPCLTKLGQYEDIDEDPEHLAKIKKALEIVKNKKVDISYIIENPKEKDVIWYNARFTGVLCEGWRMLTQEEYELLKEVFCYE